MGALAMWFHVFYIWVPFAAPHPRLVPGPAVSGFVSAPFRGAQWRAVRVRAFSVWPGSAGSARVCFGLWARSPECRRTSRSVSLLLRTLGSPGASLSDATLPALQQLQLLGRFCQEQGIPFPPISPSPEEQRRPRECHLFLDPDCPEAPAVLHFPLVSDSFREHSAPGEPPSPVRPPTSILYALPKVTPAPPPPVRFPPCLAALPPHRGPSDS